MIENRIEDDLYLLMGETYHSNSTVFVAQDEVLLVDAMASRADAERLRDFVEKELTGEVRFIVSTHYFSDHMAALRLFPRATVIAHQNYLDTFNSEQYRSEEERGHFVEPDILIADGIKIRWGRYTLDVFHNPGHTTSMLAIDVPEADLLMVGDTVVGNIAYLSYSTPEHHTAALGRLQRRARGRLISSHGDVRSPAAIDNALFYLERLRDLTGEARASVEGEQSLLEAPLESCLPTGVEPTPFEKIFHERNLQTVIERKLFEVLNAKGAE
jgi:glyoxylase-like metal-dependent hydrolase (beta-lactamase superfamily II)